MNSGNRLGSARLNDQMYVNVIFVAVYKLSGCIVYVYIIMNL